VVFRGCVTLVLRYTKVVIFVVKKKTAWDPVEHSTSAIQRALETQTKTGWQHLFQECLAKEWQSLYLQSPNLTEATYQRNWTSTVYSAMLSFFNSSWKEPNESSWSRPGRFRKNSTHAHEYWQEWTMRRNLSALISIDELQLLWERASSLTMPKIVWSES
jgi:hypothetical protein